MASPSPITATIVPSAVQSSRLCKGGTMPGQRPIVSEAATQCSPILDWAVCTGCALHDSSKALEWALAPHVVDKEMLKDMHIAIESCRNSFDLLVQYMPQFLARYMERSAAPYSKDDVASWWRCMGAPADRIEVLANLNPFWWQGKLVVPEKIDGKIVSADEVADCLLHVFKLSKIHRDSLVVCGCEL